MEFEKFSILKSIKNDQKYRVCNTLIEFLKIMQKK